MANTVIQLKYSAIPSAVPASLADGEIALNYADGKFYYKNVTGQIVSFSGSGNVFSFATINANNSLITALSNNSILSIRPGVGIGITSDIINDIITIDSYASYNLAQAAFGYANGISAGSGGAAFDQANTKTYTFFQNTAPATSNAHDLWVNSDTGVVYENFGTNTSPIWAEFGPTGVNAGNAPGSGSFTNLTVSGNVNVNKQVIVTYTPTSAVNAAIEVYAANTRGGIGYADFLSATNLSGGATNPNKFFRLGSTGTIEIINSAYTATLASLSDGGNLSISGTISAGAYSAGQVIKDVMLSNSEVTVVSTTIATSGSVTNFVTYNYTPVSASSYLIVHYHLSKYQPQGTTDDSWYSQLLVDGEEIAYGWQMLNDNGTGTSGRSGVLFPLTGRYTNSNTSTKQIQVAARRDVADDSIIIDNSSTSMWLRITEIAR